MRVPKKTMPARSGKSRFQRKQIKENRSMKHLTPISKASADKQVPWLDTLSLVVSILSMVIPLVATIITKGGGRR